jgi:hypothetical protein
MGSGNAVKNTAGAATFVMRWLVPILGMGRFLGWKLRQSGDWRSREGDESGFRMLLWLDFRPG